MDLLAQKMDPLIGSALISAGSGLVGSVFGGASNKKAAKIQAKQSEKNLDKQIAYNREMSELQWQRNLEQWNRENAYNDPSQVVARLQKSGLSPALALGSYGGNTAASSPTYSTSPVDFSKVKSKGAGFMGQSFANFLQHVIPSALGASIQYAGIKDLMENVKLKESQADLNRVNAFVTQMNGMMKFASDRFDYNMKKRLQLNTIEMALRNLDKLTTEINLNKKKGELYDQQKAINAFTLWKGQVEKDKYQRMGILPGENGLIQSLKGLFYGIFKSLSGSSDRSGFFDY